MDRFGPCSECPTHGISCVNDTAILAPNYYWKWPSHATKDTYRNFVENILNMGPEYNKNFSRFHELLPKPLKCPYPDSCYGGIDSACHVRYKGILCATCSNNHFFRFNNCLECPRTTVTIISCVVVVTVFVAVFLLVLWGDSRRTEKQSYCCRCCHVLLQNRDRILSSHCRNLLSTSTCSVAGNPSSP